MKRKKILILGGGYGGLAVMRKLARRLPSSDYSICLINESPFHTIKTRFHELAVYRVGILGGIPLNRKRPAPSPPCTGTSSCFMNPGRRGFPGWACN